MARPGWSKERVYDSGMAPKPKPNTMEPTPAANRQARRHPRAQELPKLAFSITETVHVLGVSRQVIYRMIAQDQLRTVMAGSRRLVRLAEIQRLLNTAD
jgi:excisionase family DNA binding protein